MDGLNILAGLVNEARTSASGKAIGQYCGAALLVKCFHGVFFLYRVEQDGNRGRELTASEAVGLLDAAYLAFTEEWQLGLSARARQVLQRYGVFTLQELERQLKTYDEATWRARQNCGLRTYGEIKEHFNGLVGVTA